MMNETPASKRRRGDDGAVLNDTAVNGESSVTMASPSVENGSNPVTTAIQSYRGATTPTSSSSTLPCPTLQLTGHTGSVYALKYSPSGSTLCSASFDMTCLLWQHRPLEYDISMDDDDDDDHDDHVNGVYTNHPYENSNVATYHNFHVLRGHKNAVLDCSWFAHDNRTVVTASADQTLMLWDIASQQRLRKYTSYHTGIINAVTTINEHQFVSASDDHSILVWDRRSKHPTGTYTTQYPVLAVAAAVNTSHGGGASEYQIYTAGIDPVIRIWDIRCQYQSTNTASRGSKLEEGQQLDQIHGHGDTVTCLSVHPEGTHLLSNSMDRSLMQWDIRPFVAPKTQHAQYHYSHHHHAVQDSRHVRTYTGHEHSAEKGLLKCSWSADGTFVSAGSSDTRVHIWDVLSGQELYDLPGHKGCVNAVTFHPTEPTVIASGSSDKQIFVGELS